MCTLLSKVGACLNSLYLRSNDPSDLNVITPGHFLVGESLVGLPEPGEDEGEGGGCLGIVSSTLN